MDNAPSPAETAARATDARATSNGARQGRQTKAAFPAPPAPAPLLKPYSLAAALGAVATLTLVVSLKHLADGIQGITQSSTLEAWACAIIFDASYCVAEITLILIPTLGLTIWHKRAAYSVIVACTLTSIALNCLAFRQHANTVLDIVLATTWGTIVPLLVLVLAYLATSVIVAARK